MDPFSAVLVFPATSESRLFAPVLTLLGGETDGDRVGRQYFEIDSTLGAGDDLTLFDATQFPLGATLRTGHVHQFSSVPSSCSFSIYTWE
jgi:hypothetical protein